MKRLTHVLVVGVLCWSVQGMLFRVIDGDTFVANLKIWHGLTVQETIRLLGVDAPEPRMRGGPEATNFTHLWLQRGSFMVKSCGRDSFGRVLGTVFRDSVSPIDDLTQELIKHGHGMK